MTDPREQSIAARYEKAVAGDPYPFADIQWLLAQLQQSRQEQERLTAASSAWREAYEDSLQRRDQAEQQRDAAHAALKRYGQHEDDCDYEKWSDGSARMWKPAPACTCGLDAAIAASAPQKGK